MLAEDATFAMPPYPGWYRGRDALSKSWLMPSGLPAGLRDVPTRANGQLALGAYKLDPQEGSCLPVALDVLSLRGARIAAITAFRTARGFRGGAPQRTGLGEGRPLARRGPDAPFSQRTQRSAGSHRYTRTGQHRRPAPLTARHEAGTITAPIVDHSHRRPRNPATVPRPSVHVRPAPSPADRADAQRPA